MEMRCSAPSSIMFQLLRRMKQIHVNVTSIIHSKGLALWLLTCHRATDDQWEALCKAQQRRTYKTFASYDCSNLLIQGCKKLKQLRIAYFAHLVRRRHTIGRPRGFTPPMRIGPSLGPSIGRISRWQGFWNRVFRIRGSTPKNAIALALIIT